MNQVPKVMESFAKFSKRSSLCKKKKKKSNAKIALKAQERGKRRWKGANKIYAETEVIIGAIYEI